MPSGRDPITMIVEGKLYLGDRHAASSWYLMQSRGITHVVNAAVEQPNFFPDQLVYYNCNMKDNHSQEIDFQGPLSFIQEAVAQGGAVFVHCMLGVSRSASLVVGYLMMAYGLRLREALGKVVELRPCAKPNRNFLQQLQELEAALFAAGQGSSSLWGETLPASSSGQFSGDSWEAYSA